MSEDNIPAVPMPALVQTPITPGAETSEGKMAASAQTVLTVTTYLSAGIGGLATVIPSASKWGMIAAWIVTICSQVGKVIVSLGYGQGRVAVKTSPYTGALTPTAKALLPLVPLVPLVLLLLASGGMTGCAQLKTSTFRVPHLNVSAVQYEGQIRPLIVISEAAFSSKLSPSQTLIINNALLALDRQAATSTTVDIMPVIISVAAAEIGGQAGSRITLTPNEQAGAALGLALLAEQDNPTIRALVPVLQDTLASAKVVPKSGL